MSYLFKIFFDVRFLKFIIVGSINTLVGLIITFVLYQMFHMGYWGSTFISFVLASILSFILNKNYTFNTKGKNLYKAVKFSVMLTICYFTAYKVARPLVQWVTSIFNILILSKYSEQVSILAGMFIFTIMNYLSQRFIVFNGKNNFFIAKRRKFS